MAVALGFKASPKDGQCHVTPSLSGWTWEGYNSLFLVQFWENCCHSCPVPSVVLYSWALVKNCLDVLWCVPRARGVTASHQSLYRVIHRAKQVTGPSPCFFQSSSPSDCSAAQELAILANASEEPDLFTSLNNHLFESNSAATCAHLLRAVVSDSARSTDYAFDLWSFSSVKEMNNKQNRETANCCSRSWPKDLLGLMKDLQRAPGTRPSEGDGVELESM